MNNNIHKILNKNLIINNTNQPLSKVGENVLKNVNHYDKHMASLVDKIKSLNSSKEVEKLLYETAQNGSELEMIDHVLYKYKDFYITDMFSTFGKPMENNLRILNDMQLCVAPLLIETIEKDGTLFLITKIPGTRDGHLETLRSNKYPASKEARLFAYQEMQKLTKAGYVDDSVLRGSWYTTPTGTVVAPVWRGLRKIQPDESQQEIMEQYYNSLLR